MRPPQRMLETITAASSRTGAHGGIQAYRQSRRTILNFNPHPHIPIHIPLGQGLARAAWPRTAPPAAPRRPSGIARAAAPRRQAVSGLSPVSQCSLTHAHTRHTRPGPAVSLKPLPGGSPLVRVSRGRPPMRGPGGAPHGRCQPVRWAGSGGVVGQGRQEEAVTGGSAWGGSPGRAQGRQWGWLRQECVRYKAPRPPPRRQHQGGRPGGVTAPDPPKAAPKVSAPLEGACLRG